MNGATHRGVGEQAIAHMGSDAEKCRVFAQFSEPHVNVLNQLRQRKLGQCLAQQRQERVSGSYKAATKNNSFRIQQAHRIP